MDHRAASGTLASDMNDGTCQAREGAWRATISNKNG
jgi:hypothetical protein